MEGRSRKKVVKSELMKRGEQTALPTFSEVKKDKDVKSTINAIGKQPKKKGIIFKILPIVLIIVLVIVAAFVIRTIDFGVTEMIWKVGLTRGSDKVNNKSVSYQSFANGLVRISNDGVTLIDDSGKIKWTKSYNIKDPIYVTCGKYFAIADKNGNNYIVFDEKEVIKEETTKAAIQMISLNELGKISILLSDDDKTYIDEIGELDTNFVPTDFNVNKNGSKYGFVFNGLVNDSLISKASFYFKNIENNGSLSKKEMIKEFEDKFLVRVHYFDNDNCCLIYAGGIYFVDTVNDEIQIRGQVEFNDRIKSITYNDYNVVIITEDDVMQVYSKTGIKLSSKTVDMKYEKFYISDDYIIFIEDKRVVIYDLLCNKIFDRELTFKAEYVAKKKSLLFTELLVGLLDGVECIRFY